MKASDPRLRGLSASRTTSRADQRPASSRIAASRGPTPHPRGAAFALGAGWLAAEAAIAGGLHFSGLAPYPAEAAMIALSVTTPPAIAAAWAMLAARVERAEEAVHLAPLQAATPAPESGTGALSALRGELAEDRMRLEEVLAGLSARLDAATAERQRLAQRLGTGEPAAAPLSPTPAPLETAAAGFAEEAAAPIRPAATPTPFPRVPQDAELPLFVGDPVIAAAEEEAQVIDDDAPEDAFDIASPGSAAEPSAPEDATGIEPQTGDEGETEDRAADEDAGDTGAAPGPTAAAKDAAAEGPVEGSAAAALAEPEPEGPSEHEWAVLIRALDFPRDADDAEGFEALAEAVRDPLVSDLLQAAEDTLTLLAQHNIYMEDLEVAPASASAWEAFAAGERGGAAKAAGGVQEAGPVDTVRALHAHDAIFRDTAQHLMRRYEALLRQAAAAPGGTDRMPALADTRTGRAFMLTARASGAFD